MTKIAQLLKGKIMNTSLSNLITGDRFLLASLPVSYYLLGGSAPKAQRSSTLPEVTSAASKADLFLSSYSDRYPQESLSPLPLRTQD